MKKTILKVLAIAFIAFVSFHVGRAVQPQNTAQNVEDPASGTSSYQSRPLVELINEVRQKAGKAPVVENEALNRAARARNSQMIINRYWDHFDQEKKSWYDTVKLFAPFNARVGENLAICFTNNEEVVKGWINSPTHYELMIGNFTQVGTDTQQSAGQITANHGGTQRAVKDCALTTAEFAE